MADSSFTQELADELCRRLTEGRSLRSICLDEDMPAKSTVLGWLARNEHPGFLDQYACAREIQADCLVDETIDIADDGTNDWMERHSEDGANIGWRENGEALRRSQLRIDTRKWIAGKMRPKKYGDATMIKHADADGEKLPMDDVTKFSRLASIFAQQAADREAD